MTSFPTWNAFQAPTFRPRGSPGSPTPPQTCPMGFVVNAVNNRCDCPAGFAQSHQSRMGCSATTVTAVTCPPGFYVLSAATAVRGVSCMSGVMPNPPPPAPTAAPVARPTTPATIVFTDVILGITLATFNQNNGIASYAADLAIVINVSPSQITVVVITPRRNLEQEQEQEQEQERRGRNMRGLQASSSSSSVMVQVTVSVPQTMATRVQTTLQQPASTTSMSSMIKLRGGVFANAATQGATIPGVTPTRLPTRLPTLPPVSVAPTRPPTNFPSVQFKSVSTQYPTNWPTDTAEAAGLKGEDAKKTEAGLSNGAIAGIAIVIILVVAGVAYFGLFAKKKAGEGYGGGDGIEDFYGQRKSGGTAPTGFVPYVGTRGSIGGRESGGSFSQNSPVHDPNVRASLSKGSGGRESFSGGQGGGGGGGRASFTEGRRLSLTGVGGGRESFSGAPKRPSFSAGKGLSGNASVGSASVAKRPSITAGPGGRAPPPPQGGNGRRGSSAYDL